jgi:hypothetical protein
VVPNLIAFDCIDRSSLSDKFPTPLFVRTLAFGAILGTIEGGLRIAQAKVGSLRGTEEEPEAQSSA